MKRTTIALSVLGMAVCGAVPSLLPRAAAQEQPQGQQSQQTSEATPSTAAERRAERIENLGLTDEQAAKIEEIRTEYRPKIQEAGQAVATVVKEEVEKIKTVLTAEQVTKVDEMMKGLRQRRSEGLAESIAQLREFDLTEAEREKIQQIRGEYRPKLEASLKQMGEVLTAEQRKTRDEMLEAGKPRAEVLAALNLTPDQKEKLRGIGKELGSTIHEELQKIHEVLTDEQNQKLEDLKDEHSEHVRDRRAYMIANMRELNLTDDQRTKIAEIRNEYRPKVQAAGDQLRAVIRQEVRAIVEVLQA